MHFFNRRNFIVLNTVLIFCMVLGVLLYGRSESGTGPSAIRGVMDLSGMALTPDSIIRLKGDWEFYWNQLLGPEDFEGRSAVRPQLTGYIKVPSIWVSGIKGMRLPARGYATYRLRVRLKPTDMMLVVKTVNIRMASRVYINGKELLNSGVPAEAPQLHVPGNTPQTAFFTVDGDSLELVVQVANYVYENGGILQNIYFGGQKAIIRKGNFSAAFDIMIFSSLVMIGITHIIVYIAAIIRKRREPYIITFGLMCMALAIGNSGLGEKLMFLFFPRLPAEIGYKISDVCISACFFLMAIFLSQVGKDIVPKAFTRIVALFFGYSVLSIAFTSLSVQSSFRSVYLVEAFAFSVCVIVFFSIALIKKRYGNIGKANLMILLTALIYLMIYMLDFILYLGSYKESYFIAGISSLMFVLMLSALLANKFSEAVYDIQSMSERLLTLDKLKDEFLANTSHELQTPINGILNISQSILEGSSGSINEAQKRNIAIVVGAAKRLSDLINDILDMARLKRNEIKLKFLPVDVKSNVGIVFDMLRFVLPVKDIQLTDCLPEELPPVHADENRLRQVLYNLISNAMKYTESGTIAVCGELKGGRLKITVEDTGIGIPEDKHDLIFQYFEQVDGSITTERKGTGLGLPISRRLVELMGGTLVLEWSEPGKGSRFAFELPVSDEQAPVCPLPEELSARTEYMITRDGVPELLKGGEHRILLVDDELSNLYVLLNILGNENYDILTASDGRTALECVRKNRDIDMVIMDVMMPKMSGIEVCRKIRAEYSLLDLPVLLVTALNTPEYAAVGFEAGANDFVVKPLEARMVRARVKTLLRLKTAMKEAVKNEMAFLQSQIKPHFIYNALNSVSSLCITDGEMASELVDQLSFYMRKCFKGVEKNSVVSLVSELELVKAYVNIEKVRFGDRLSVEYRVDGSLACKLPALVIQPIVENAIRHGIMRKTSGGKVVITAGMEQDKAVFIIEDDGVGISGEVLESLLKDCGNGEGVGLINIHRRLLNMYGQGLNIESGEGKGTRVSFSIPGSTDWEG